MGMVEERQRKKIHQLQAECSKATNLCYEAQAQRDAAMLEARVMRESAAAANAEASAVLSELAALREEARVFRAQQYHFNEMDALAKKAILYLQGGSDNLTEITEMAHRLGLSPE